MRYSGSKARIAKHIIPFIMNELHSGDVYIEPFVGGCNMIDKINWENKYGYDLNKYVISMWSQIKEKQYNIFPKAVSEEDYNAMKKLALMEKSTDDKYPEYLIGYVGNACSYGSAWFNGYAKYNEKRKENHILEAWNGLSNQIKDFKNLSTTSFVNQSYEEAFRYALSLKRSKGVNSVIYCDPPYKGTKGYMAKDFNHDRFWNLVRRFSKLGFKIFVSEYNAPDDFECVWSMERKDGMSITKVGQKQSVKTEKLFIWQKF